MIDMKMSKPELASNSLMLAGAGAGAYSYGLQLTLDAEHLKKLGLDKDLPDIDAECEIKANACVIEVSKRGESMTVRLQIKELEIKVKPESPAEEAKEEYTGKANGMRMR